MKGENQIYTDFGKMYYDIDEAANNYYRIFLQEYLMNGRFPEIYTSEHTANASCAKQLLNHLQFEWNPVRLLALLSTLGAALGMERPVPALDFCTMIEGQSLICSPYVDYYLDKKDILLATLEMFAKDEEES
ncbi:MULTISPECIES: hypothetical protein [Brevibacillus]|uniref:hypothetical protein n=1 Tax=Brevibacillus TaxID=55080 RepID=UPI000D0F36F8|nr:MULTISPECIES: hypothetical protein [Brevibacillus]PSJ71277.1 hypothetical protein C7J99_00225 [Brevibacillus brevis]RED28881.1 hypothetical protein DES34_107232 [Brevibacillus brevis]TQK61997.1 hypothetical protein FB479_10680 [Brevibacillus sp. AG162]VEF91524.1 Uncharacterised protein [Brevibacillus brevis]GEC90308.1 hypothetical protein BBR01nite_26390 [Brevibacillus brevis]